MLKNFREYLEKAAQERVREAAEEACERAKARAPVQTGALRDSISVEVDGLDARVFTDCPYAAAVEFGTPKRAPRPFMGG